MAPYLHNIKSTTGNSKTKKVKNKEAVMKTKGLIAGLLMFLLTLGMATTVFSVNVNLTVRDSNNSTSTQTYTLENMTVGNDGTVNITVNPQGACQEPLPTITIYTVTTPDQSYSNCPVDVLIGDYVTVDFTANQNPVNVTENLGGKVVYDPANGTWKWSFTADTAGQHTLELQADRGSGATCNRYASTQCVINVTDPYNTTPLTLKGVPATLPDATAGEAYNNGNPYYVNLSATGGTPPYTFRCRVKSATSQGITATPNGNTCTIEGTPDSAGYVDILFKVTDADGNKISKTKRITVNPATQTDTIPDITNGGLGDVHDPNGYQTLGPGETNYYKCIVNQNAINVQIEIGTMHGPYGNNDMLVGLDVKPDVSDYTVGEWVNYTAAKVNGKLLWGYIRPDDGNIGSDSDESVTIASPPPGTYYIMVHNSHSSETSQFFVSCGAAY